MSATTKHLSVKLTETDAAALDLARVHHGMDTDSQLVRWLLRREARALGLTGNVAADPMPPPGRKPAKSRRK